MLNINQEPTELLLYLITSVAPIQQFAYMSIFHNPYCLYADPIRYCLCEIQCILSSLQLFTHGTVLIILLFVCYKFSPKCIVHVVTGIFSLGCIHLQIVVVQFDNNVICKPEKYCVSCIGNAIACTDTLPISSL